jgi:hypothetical protein
MPTIHEPGPGTNGDRPGTEETPPKRRTAPRRSAGATKDTAKDAPPRARPGTKDAKLQESIVDLYAQGGLLIAGVGMARADEGITSVGVGLANGSQAIGEAWMDLADKNPKVKAALLKFTEVSSVGVLVSLHVAVVLPFMADRGMVPVIPGVTAPNTGS